jgi:hypothetical protein
MSYDASGLLTVTEKARQAKPMTQPKTIRTGKSY